MNFLNRITIKTRMVLAGVFMALLFILFGLIFISQMRQLGNLTATLYNHPLQVSNAALKAKVGIIRMHRSMKDVSTSTTQLSATLAIETVLMEEQKVYAELARIRDLILGEEGKTLVEETTTLFAGWKPIRVEVEELVMQGKREEANKITRGKGADYVAHLERKMAALTDYAIHKANGFMADAEQTEAQIVTNAIIFIAAMVLAGIGIGIFMAASIVSSLSSLKEAMTEITGSGKLTEVSLSGQNEITNIAEHFNGLLVQLKRQFWLGDGQNKLNKALSGELSYDEILEKGIQTVCRHTDACAGALYRFDSETKMCELKSSYALVERTHLADQFALGKGIVGQVALEKKPILLTQISRSDAVGQSGIINEPPKAVFALPLIYEDELYGVIEIATFEEIKDIKQRYLESASGTIAMFLNTAYQNDRIKQLFNLSQETNEKLKIQARELKIQTEELQALNEEFQQQSQELKSQNLALEEQRTRVEEANRLKSEFLSNMSHELRTPLNSVNALSKVLISQTKNKLDKEEKEYLSIIEKNGRHLLNLINDILDLSKIEAGRMDLTVSTFSLNALVNTIIESISPLAQEKGLDIETDLSASLKPITNDESRVMQILQNIVANAVKFTEQGYVRISTGQADQDTIFVKVEDSGIGISAQNLDSIFEEFRQVDGASTRKYQGTGLGLSIAYKSAKLLGGDIQVRSTPDQGATFTVTLPIKNAHPLYNRAYITKTKKAAQEFKSADTILAVDDNPQVLETLQSVLTHEGYRCVTATSGKEALELARIHKPKAITLDIIMPNMDGWEVLELLKTDPVTKNIPVIIISKTRDQSTGLALGAVGYITKPVSKKTIVDEIKKLSASPPSDILVVDDDPTALNQSADLFSEQGMSVRTAANGIDCLKHLENKTPDLVVLDLVMPDMDGFQVLKYIRSHDKTCHLPVIIVTAKDLSAEEKQMLESQASAVFTKGMAQDSDLVIKIKDILTTIGLTHHQSTEPFQGHLSNELKTKGTQPGKILLVEDNDVVVIQIKDILESIGIKVIVAQNGRQALGHMQNTIPDGIILDLMMPEMDGFQVLESLRGTSDTHDIPVLILTAKDLSKEELKRLSANNIFQLIQKGDVDQEELTAHVRQMMGLPKESPTPENICTQTPRQLEPDSKPLILAIEDNPDNLITIKAVLGSQYAVIGAGDGKQGLEKAVSILPDIILLDISLPLMDGFEVVRALKDDQRTCAIPVIALTAQAMKGDRKKILEAGCDDYVAKPIDPVTITQTLDRWLTSSSRIYNE